MLSAHLKSTLLDKNQKQFGCSLSACYKELHIINMEHCLTVSPAGIIKLNEMISPLAKHFSPKRLQVAYFDKLAIEIQDTLNKLYRSKEMMLNARAITSSLLQKISIVLFTYLLRSSIAEKEPLPNINEEIIETHLKKILQSEAIKLFKGNSIDLVTKIAHQLFNDISSPVLEPLQLSTKKNQKKSKKAQKSADSMLQMDMISGFILKNRISNKKTINAHFFKDVLFDNQDFIRLLLQNTIQSHLLTIFDNESCDYLKNELDKYLYLDLISLHLQSKTSILQQINTLIFTKLADCLAINTKKSKHTLAQLQHQPQQVEHKVINSQIDTEQLMINQLEQWLLPTEANLLEKNKVTIIAVTHDFFEHQRMIKPNDYTHLNPNGKFILHTNTIYVKIKCIQSSLIHEVQHSLGFDLRPQRFKSYLKFFKKCKTLHLPNKHNFLLSMIDYNNVLDIEKNIQKYPQITNEILNKAKYILTLPNYNPEARNGEILAHLRQFIATYGAEHAQTLFPKLYQFWDKEILPLYPPVLAAPDETITPATIFKKR